MNQPTSEQKAITDFVADPKAGNLIVQALAGSGKTSTILASLKRLPQRSALLCAFNKRIATELEAKLPTMPRTHAAHVKTFHAIGLRVLKQNYPHLQVNSNATEDLLQEVYGTAKMSFQVRRAAVRLLRVLKETCVKIPADLDEATVFATGWEYELFDKLNAGDPRRVVDIVRDCYARSSQLSDRQSIDFCDMVWAPVVLDLVPPSRYQAIFVDELQDISEPQFELLKRHLVPKIGRFIGIGDSRQRIYSWRGAIGDSIWATFTNELKATTLPLTTTFRCSKAVVTLANEIVPELTAMDRACEGSITTCLWSEMPDKIRAAREINPEDPDDLDGASVYVLSRNNADLLQAALFLWRARVRFQLNAGREMLDPLFEILDKLDRTNTPRFRSSLTTWYYEANRRAEAAGAVAWAERLQEQYMMLDAASKYAEPNQIEGLLRGMLTDSESGVLLSTVHKVKGLEADVVFLLRQTFGRYRERFNDDPVDEEELNIEYVAVTRARRNIVWVDMASQGYYVVTPVDTIVRSDDAHLTMGTDLP